MERLGKKIKKLLEEVHRIELCQKVNVQAAQIQYVNSVIMGMAPVSYTHLDVYKRQIMDMIGKCDLHGRRWISG